jgi:hypothetical protein
MQDSAHTANPAPITLNTLAGIFGNDTIIDVIDDYSNAIPPKDWVIENICTVGECAMLAGASKSGKSYIATNAAIAVASGGKLFGRFQCKKGRVLYLNGENSQNDARERFHMVFDAMGVCPQNCEQIIMICADGILKSIQELKDILIAEIKQNHYMFVVLDPLYCFYQGSEIDEQDAKNFVATIKEICRQTGAVILCVHHHSKGAAAYRNASNRASGSGMLQRAFSTLLDITEIDSTEGTMLPEGQRAFELSGQPRQASGFKINLIFDFPRWVYDAEGAVPDNAICKGRTAKARQNNPNLRKAEELRVALPVALNEAFVTLAQIDSSGEYVTVGNVIEMLRLRNVNVSERSVCRAIDDGKVPGFRRDERAGHRSKIRKLDFVEIPESVVPMFA